MKNFISRWVPAKKSPPPSDSLPSRSTLRNSLSSPAMSTGTQNTHSMSNHHLPRNSIASRNSITSRNSIVSNNSVTGRTETLLAPETTDEEDHHDERDALYGNGDSGKCTEIFFYARHTCLPYCPGQVEFVNYR